MVSKNLNPLVENKKRGDHYWGFGIGKSGWRDLISRRKPEGRLGRRKAQGQLHGCMIYAVTQSPVLRRTPALDLKLGGHHIEILNTFEQGPPPHFYFALSPTNYGVSPGRERWEKEGIGGKIWMGREKRE